MSKVKIQGNASGTGVLTIAAPNTSTDRTITLPDSTGTILDENSSLPAANLTGTVADARISTLTASKLSGALPAISGASLTGIDDGKIVQIVTTTSTTATYPSTGWTSVTGSSLSITPTASNSKLLYWMNSGGFVNGNTGDLALRIKRDISGGAQGTDLRECGRWGYHHGSGIYSPLNLTINWLDTPSTTSQVTYYCQALKQHNAGAYEINDSQQTHGMLTMIMEIAQ